MNDEITPGRKRLINNSKKNEIEWEINQDIMYENELEVGTKVFHKKFGNGKILNLDSDKAIVNFENFNSKKIYLKYLKVID